jgi:hypothetical protein
VDQLDPSRQNPGFVWGGGDPTAETEVSGLYDFSQTLDECAVDGAQSLAFSGGDLTEAIGCGVGALCNGFDQLGLQPIGDGRRGGLDFPRMTS